MTGLMTLALIFIVLMAFFRPLTWTNKSDGMVAVLLGLYVCSHPAANLLDLILFGRQTWFEFSRKANYLWIGFNLFVIFIGWIVIVAGTTRFMSG
jgi:hypothetical protein